MSYLGKLIVSKGVDLLFAAWPLVVARVPQARLVVVGFGTYRQALGRFVDALGRRDLETLREIAARGRELEGGPPGELKYLRSFLESVSEAWLKAAPAAAARIHFTGRIEHHDLPSLLPVCEAQVMPSTFPEAFGMVAVEAAACGALPLSARHSGMAEVTATLAPALPDESAAAPLVRNRAWSRGGNRRKLVAWLTLDAAERERARVGAGERGGAPLQLGSCGERGDRGGPRQARRATPTKPPCALDYLSSTTRTLESVARRFACFAETTIISTLVLAGLHFRPGKRTEKGNNRSIEKNRGRAQVFVHSSYRNIAAVCLLISQLDRLRHLAWS